MSVRPERALPALERLADGTVRQVNPFTGTEVWTVPGRGSRPLVPVGAPHHRIDPLALGRTCAFCEKRYLDTTPEKARVVRDPDGTWRTLTGLTAEELDDTVAELRLIPNLFEIVSFDYWRLNHAFSPPPEAQERQRRYLSTVGGIAHVERLQAIRAEAGGAAYRLDAHSSEAFFAGMHDVVVARRHFAEGALCEDELAGSGTLSVEEHREYVAFTIAAMHRLYAASPLVASVAAFQNWLRPAGASFDHLHKQLVALDTLGRTGRREAALLAGDPEMFVRDGVELAREHDLVIAENDHAVAVAGIGHRFPSIEIWSTDVERSPWELERDQLDGFADLLRDMHRGTGPQVPTNEEWHHRPRGLEGKVPMRVVLKWRLNTPAGFEGGTGIHVNTVDPWSVKERVLAALD